MTGLSRRNAVGTLFWVLVVLITLPNLLLHFSFSETFLAKLWLFLSLSLAVTALIVANPLSARYRIGAVGIAYLALTLAFASLHFLAYKADRFSYIFAESIAERQTLDAQAAARESLADDRAGLAVIDELLTHWHATYEGFSARGTVVLPSGAKAELTMIVAPDVGGVSQTVELTKGHRTLELQGGKLFEQQSKAIETLLHPGSSEREVHASLLSLREVVAMDASRQASIVGAKEAQWGYPDFVYFSAVTMTTLGYGDIVPAHSLTRSLVTLQSLSGVLLVTFALTFLWPRSHGNGTPTH